MVRKEYQSVGKLCEELGGHKRESGKRCKVNLSDGRVLRIKETNGILSVNMSSANSLHKVRHKTIMVERKAAHGDQQRGDVMLEVEYNPTGADIDSTHEQFWLR